MASIAVIGPDGSGKTTLTRMLTSSHLMPFKYLYMGIDIPPGAIALPTTRLAERLKKSADGEVRPGGPHPRTSRSRPRGPFGALLRMLRGPARLANRIAEESFRQCLSWQYQMRGWVMLYDRHFVFDFSPEITAGQCRSLDNRLHEWLLSTLYPRPSLVIFLDAPGTLLFARKGESTVEELERRRQAFLTVGKRVDNFVRVDATKPLAEVYREVASHIVRAFSDRRRSSRSLEAQ